MNYLLNGMADVPLQVSDRGLHYGDGVFETLLWRQSGPVFLTSHYQRLSEGCQRLGFAAPAINALRSDCEQLGAGRKNAVLKIIVTRGSGGRGYRPPDNSQVTRLVSIHEPPDYPDQLWQSGIQLTVCNTRLGRNPALAGLKHLNRLEQVLAQAEFTPPHSAAAGPIPTPVAHEGLMRDEHGYVVEGTMSNLHIVESERIVTPSLAHCGVSGIIRAKVQHIAQKLKIDWLEDDITLNRVFAADEVFVTNSIVGVWPVRRLLEHGFDSIAVAKILQVELNKMMEAA